MSEQQSCGMNRKQAAETIRFMHDCEKMNRLVVEMQRVIAEQILKLADLQEQVGALLGRQRCGGP